MTTAPGVPVFSMNDPDIVPDYIDGKGKPKPAPAAPETPVVAASAASPAHRAGECVPNVPDAAPAFLSPAEEQSLAAAAANETAEPAVIPPAAAPAPWWRWGAAATVLFAGIFGVLIFSQTISALAFAATLPVWAQYALLIPFGLSCLAVLWVCAGLVRAYLRLRAVRQIDLGALEELRLRAQTRQDGMEQYKAARTHIEDYLKRYPLSADGQPRLLAAGLTAAQVGSLADARDFLVGRAQDSRAWLAEYREQYQKTLDKAAAARVSAWSLRAAGCVIASPLPLLDAVLVLGVALKLIKDLSVLYNVRTGRAGTLLILRKAIAAAFIAGVAEEATEAAGELATEHLAGLAGAKIAGAVAPKLGEGVVNALFIRHVGRATIKLLQPAKPANTLSANKGKQ